MVLTKLENKEQFDSLKKNDVIVVQWNPGSSEYKKGKVIGHYSMLEVNSSNEVILQKKDNVYFIISMYLKGESAAKEAYVVSL